MRLLDSSGAILMIDLRPTESVSYTVRSRVREASAGGFLRLLANTAHVLRFDRLVCDIPPPEWIAPSKSR